MGIRNLVRTFLSGGTGEIPDPDCQTINLKAEMAYKKLYVNTAIDLIARALVACDFESYRDGKIKRSLNYYQLNVSPNKNESAHEFWTKVVYNLVYENEALVIQIGEQLWVADSFYRETTNGLKEFSYKTVSINGELLSKEFKESEVLYFTLSNESINSVIDSLYNSYGILLAKAMSDYKGNGRLRYIARGRFMTSLTDENGKAAQSLFEEKMKDYTNPEKLASVMFLPDQVNLEDQTKELQKMDTRDIKNIAKDMLEFVASAFHIPPSLLSGIPDPGSKEQQGDLDNFILFAVRPIGEMIAGEYNRKFLTKDQFLTKTYIKFDMKNFKLFDLTKFANAVDKLFAVGGLSINDVIERSGGEVINEEWANERYVTKNYERARLSGQLEGGDANENGQDTTEILDDGQQGNGIRE
ncbi:phage portal protein [Bacillus toyonensis]|uniref:phage portal protein n=1 Tax=Bacillus toyonensis TaxID=155322 RepID=UPI00027BEA40|nr:phage portal protein [Bacillus toyonensis]EJV41732.1 HK97 family phage portal protein [Bacillus toyonensis]